MVTEDKMVGWHWQCNECELGQTPGDGEGQGSLACFSPWVSRRVRHNLATEQQQSTEYMPTIFIKVLSRRI